MKKLKKQQLKQDILIAIFVLTYVAGFTLYYLGDDSVRTAVTTYLGGYSLATLLMAFMD